MKLWEGDFMSKVCTKCNIRKSKSEFYKAGYSKKGTLVLRGVCKDCEKASKRVKDEDRVIPNSQITNDIVYKKCKQMAYSARSRVMSPSKYHKTPYKDIPFGFKGGGELKWYLYDNFYKDIKIMLDEGEVPSLDRIDSSKGYEEGNLRIIPFSLNTQLGVEARKRKVRVTNLETNEILYFESTSDCVEYFGFSRESTTKISSWVKRDGLYKIPEGFIFEYEED